MPNNFHVKNNFVHINKLIQARQVLHKIIPIAQIEELSKIA